ELLVAGIEYHEINGRRYEMSLLDEEIETYLSSVYPTENSETQTPVSKTLMEAQRLNEEHELVGDPFTCVLSDSAVENDFAHDCSVDDNVKFFFKLPSRFKVPTPLGTYNPDWAVVFEDDARVYFVAETKSSTVRDQRRTSENLRIDCGRKHFALAQDVIFKDVTKLDELTA
ncbi:MAG: type III restriction endonuclease, partial [Burkholderiales bacterium]|nr:type III restriction endonuclease [Burkholderiales bacterium]